MMPSMARTLPRGVDDGREPVLDAHPCAMRSAKQVFDGGTLPAKFMIFQIGCVRSAVTRGGG